MPTLPDAHAVRAESDRIEFETLLPDISAQLVAADPDRLEETIESALDADCARTDWMSGSTGEGLPKP